MARSGNFISGRDKRADELKTALGGIRRDLDGFNVKQMLTFGGSCTSTTAYLLPNYAGPLEDTRIVSGMAALPSIIGNWTVPNGTNDFWTATAAGHSFYHPVPLQVGETLTKLQLWFYRGAANNPTISLRTAAAGAAASTVSPTVAWTNPSASTTWELLEASYDESIGATMANYHVRTQADNIGDRIRSIAATVRSKQYALTGYESVTVVPFACKLSGIRVWFPTVGVGTGSLVFTVRRNGADTSLTATVKAVGQEAAESGSVVLEAGDRVSVKVATTGSVTTHPDPVQVSLEVLV